MGTSARFKTKNFFLVLKTEDLVVFFLLVKKILKMKGLKYNKIKLENYFENIKVYLNNSISFISY